MSVRLESRTVAAIVFFGAAMALLLASVRTTTLAEKAADEARYGLIPQDKAMKALDFTLPAVATGSGATSVPANVNLLSTAKETPVVFSFWAGYCQYCPLEMSHLEKYADQYKGKIQIYTVNSNDSPEMIKKYAAAHSLSLPVLVDSTHKVATDYGIDSLPTLFLVDKQGRVRYVENGYDPQMDTVFPKVIDALLKDS